jgi:anaerobic selenocysteine-containing dehydrogenase
MKLLFRLIVLILLAGGWALAGASVHFVRGPGPIPKLGMIHAVPKSNFSYRDTWVDTTHWTAADLTTHQAFVHRLEQAGKRDWLKHVGAAPVALGK